MLSRMIVRRGMGMGGMGFGDGEDDSSSWGADDVVGLANSSGANSVVSGIFSLFGGKTSTGRTSSSGGGVAKPATSPWLYAAGAVGVLGVGYLLLRHK